MSESPVLVVGATGTQGGAVVDALLEDGASVRALVRDPSSGSAQRLSKRGVELVKGDLEDVASLRAALQGARGVFSVQTPPGPDEGSELRTGRNLVNAAIDVGVENFVHTSVARAGDQRNFVGWNDGRVWKPYWNSKSGVNDMVRAAGFKHWVVLKPAILMDNYMPPKADMMWPLLRISGQFVTVIGRDTKIDLFDVADLGKFAAAAFANPDRFNGLEIDLASESITMSQMAAEITRVTGKTVSVQNITLDEARERGINPLVTSAEVWDNEDGYQVDINKAKSHGIRLTTFAEFADRHVKDFVVGS